MSAPESPYPASRSGRMNRSRIIAAGTSVGALFAITAGVAAANPAPSTTPTANPDKRAAETNRREGRDTDDGRAFEHDGFEHDGFEHDDGDDGWRQLPSDPSASDPGFGGATGNDVAPPPAFDPGAGGAGSNTSSGGS